MILGSIFRQKVRLLRTHCTIIVYNNKVGLSIVSIFNLGGIFTSGMIY